MVFAVRTRGTDIPEQRDHLRGLLHIGVHRDVEVTGGDGQDRAPSDQILPIDQILPVDQVLPVVSRAFCSALPVANTGVARTHWKAFASLVLEAAYEATKWALVDNARRGASNAVLLTSLGGGVFGSDESWICGAMARALRMTAHVTMDVRIVTTARPAPAFCGW
jgi:hypothetical protein